MNKNRGLSASTTLTKANLSKKQKDSIIKKNIQ